MRLGISAKLILAIVGLTTVLLGTTLLLARWSFERGFLEYVNTVEQRRLDRAATSLAEFYETFGTWRLLTPQDYTRALGNPRAGVGRGNPEGPGRRLPPPGRAPPEGKRPPDRRGPPPDAIGPPGPDPAAPATALFDASGSHVIGPAEYASDADVITSPITVDGQTVGTLYTPLRRELTEPQEAEFAVSQRNASIVIAIIGFIVSIVLAMLLARLFLSPIQKLMTAVHRISDGDFETELAPAARDELGDLMHDVNRLVMVLRENQTSRQRWLADISHELRTPIAILVAELDALRDGVRPLELSQLESFSDEVSRIHRLIDDLHQLALSDMGGLRYEFAKLELAAFLDSRAEHFYRVSETQGHTLKLNIDTDNAWINADGERLSQLLDNLVMNAISYTDSPGHIDMQLTATDNEVRLVISDSAPGIDPATYGKIFDPLYRAEDSRNRRRGGAGLGLAICQNIVSAHSGSLVAGDSELGGVSMTVTLQRVETPIEARS